MSQPRKEKKDILDCAAVQGNSVTLLLHDWSNPLRTRVTKVPDEEERYRFANTEFSLGDVKAVHQDTVLSGPPRSRKR